MNAGWLKKQVALKERQILQAKIKLEKLKAEYKVLQYTLDSQPTMEGFEYEPIER